MFAIDLTDARDGGGSRHSPADDEILVIGHVHSSGGRIGLVAKVAGLAVSRRTSTWPSPADAQIRRHVALSPPGIAASRGTRCAGDADGMPTPIRPTA